VNTPESGPRPDLGHRPDPGPGHRPDPDPRPDPGPRPDLGHRPDPDPRHRPDPDPRAEPGPRPADENPGPAGVPGPAGAPKPERGSGADERELARIPVGHPDWVNAPASPRTEALLAWVTWRLAEPGAFR